MKRILIILLIILVIPTLLSGQLSLTPSVIASGGSYYEADNISISWTIGELAISTLADDNLILTQGFQQPEGIGVGIPKKEVNEGIIVYPNPVQNELRIRFDTNKPCDYMLEIQDVTGRIFYQIQHKSIRPDDIIIINTSRIVPGIYYLKVRTSDGRPFETTCIIKTE